jgi:hypothetical protein
MKELTPAAIVDLTRSLRYKATSNLKNFGDPEKQALGIAQRRAADALDNILDARLSETGNAGLVDQYRSARQLIAMSHDVEAATNAAGDVNAKVLAGLANKGRPLSGNLETIANVASAFPRAMRDPATFGGMENLGILDMWGTAGATVAGHPGVGAALLSRPGARKIALSQPYQSLMMANRGVTAPSALGVMGSAPTAIGSDALLRLLSRQSLANPGN